MRIALAALVTLLAAATTPTPVQADPYRWCGVFGGGGAAVTNCYFVTIDQCRMSMSGNGGYCVPNQFYDARPAPGDGVVRSRRRAQG
jgi:hypothetical protein